MDERCTRSVARSLNSVAGEYHDADFRWEDVAEEGERALRSQVLQEAAADRAQGDEVDVSSWEAFHRKHGTAAFFRPRRYLLLAFPQLADAQHIAEIGAGAGAAILPVLQECEKARATVCDASATGLQLLLQTAASQGVDTGRLSCHVFDAASSGALQQQAPEFLGTRADHCLLVFTLSAVRPQRMDLLLQHSWQVLAPGGKLLFRDYGLYDLTQLRFKPHQRLADRLYRRLDGTLAYFFSLQDLQDRMVRAGFEVETCRYACVALKNRRDGTDMKRVFVHGVFRKPARADMG